jgi:hypothetical protein
MARRILAAGCGIPIADADQSAFGSHGANLIVGKIAIVIASSFHSGVRNDQRSRAQSLTHLQSS